MIRSTIAVTRAWLGVAAVAGLMILLVACGGGNDAGASPRLVLDGDEFDLGVVAPRRQVERTIAFSNGGQEPLAVSITKVRAAPDAACGCGVEGFEVRPGLVEPGGSGSLVFQLLAPEGMPAMQDKMLAELSSNDPDKERITITLLFRMGDENDRGGS